MHNIGQKNDADKATSADSFLTDAELDALQPYFNRWAASRNLTINDELFIVVHMILLSGGDARAALADYIRSEADKATPIIWHDEWTSAFLPLGRKS
jgi:hypothetical protein